MERTARYARKASLGLAVVAAGALGLAGCGADGANPGGDDTPSSIEEPLTQPIAIDFESYPLGPLGSPWSVSPPSGPSTVTIMNTADHGKVLRLHGDNAAYLFATLAFSSSATEITTSVDVRPATGASFIWILNGAGSSIGRRRIRLQHPPGTDVLQVQTVPAGTVNCGRVPSNLWSKVTLVVHAQSWPHTADVLINGAPTACSRLDVGLSPPFSSVQIMDAGNDGWAGNVDFDNIAVTTP
jgi:hypothetical protein